jgi:hypothetical protein
MVSNGKELPSLKLAKRIKDWSDGAVDITDLRPDLFD